MILRDPGTRHVSGLTTAATVWLTALLGVACGAGLYVQVLMALVLGALALTFGGRVDRACHDRWQRAVDPTKRKPPDV